MRHLCLFVAIALAATALGLLIFAMTDPSQAAPAHQLSVQPGDTVIPMGPPQAGVRTAYRDALSYLYVGGRVHWAAS
jgi:hypothetical protein